MGRDAEGEITNHIIMAKTKNEPKQMSENTKLPKKNSVRYPFSFVSKNYNKTSLEGKFQKNTNRNKRNRKYPQNGYRKYQHPKIHYFRPKEMHGKNRPSTPTVKSTRKTDIVSEVLMTNTADGTKYSVTF